MQKPMRLDETLAHWAARLSWASRGAMERRLRPHGLTPPMMAALLALGGGCERGTDLAKLMGSGCRRFRDPPAGPHGGRAVTSTAASEGDRRSLQAIEL